MGRTGSQRPTFSQIPDYDHTDGPDAVALLREIIEHPLEWQRSVLDVLLARDGDHYAATSVGCSVPRQNGKSWSLRGRAIYGAAVIGERVLYTAHHNKTADEMFRAISHACDYGPEEFKKHVTRIRRANGQQRIDFDSGGYIVFTTRTDSAGIGLSFDVIIYDEAQQLTETQQEATLPTLNTSPDPQMIFFGTPPRPTDNGTVFKDMHDTVHAGTNDSVAWVEWAVEEIGDVRDVDRWYACNPSLGILIQEKTFHGVVGSMSPDAFAREILGWWSKDGSYAHAVDAVAWGGCQIDEAPQCGVVSYGVKFKPDGTVAAVAGCVVEEGYDPHVELIAVRDVTHGMGWLVDFLSKRHESAACFMADGRGSAETVAKRVVDAGAPRAYARVAKTSDVVQASATFADMVVSHGLTHVEDPLLDASVMRASRRPIGRDGAWGFGEAPGCDPTAAEAAALAVFAAVTTKRDPTYEQEVAFF